MTQDLKTKIAEAMCLADGFNWADQMDPIRSSNGTDDGQEAYLFAAEIALQAIHDAGFAVVPREPTEAMFEAGFDATSVELHPGEHPDDVNNPAVCWRAMLSASQPKTEEG